jgi:hypothetical protein
MIDRYRFKHGERVGLKVMTFNQNPLESLDAKPVARAKWGLVIIDHFPKNMVEIEFKDGTKQMVQPKQLIIPLEASG